MLKALLKLLIYMILPVTFLLFVEAYNPFRYVSNHFTEQFIVNSYKGTLYLLEEKLSKIPEEDWLEEIDHMGQQFGYQIKLRPFNSLEADINTLNRISQGETVLYDIEWEDLAHKIPGSNWVVILSTEETLDEINHRAASGTFYLLRDHFQQTPQDQWPLLIKQLQKKFGFPIELIPIGEISLPAKRLAKLKEGELVWSMDDEDETYYGRLQISNQVLMAGPISDTKASLYIISSFIVIVIVCMVIAGIYWLLPFLGDLKVLARHASQFGNGQLDTRVKIKKGNLVAGLGNSFNQMADSIEKLIKANQHLTNAVAHDLRTPLARLRFAFEILETEECSETEKARFRKSIHESITALDYLINQTLMHARYSRKPGTEQFKSSPLASMITNEVDQWSQSQQVEIDLRISPELLKTEQIVDARAIIRALDNLLSNGAKYADQVRVSYSQDSKHLKIRVEDNGPGIDESCYDTIFQPFAQVNNTERDLEAGHGLGLAIVNQIAQWHKGTVSVSRSETLGGACFEIIWPDNPAAL